MRRHADGTFSEITIDTSNNTISVNCGELQPTMRLTKNADFVVKLNKTSVSTCSIDMLAYALQNDVSVFDHIAFHIMRIDREITTGEKMSRAAFYNTYFSDHNGVDDFVAFFNLVSNKTRQLIIRDHMCDDHTAKMSGMISYSTSVEENIYCRARMRCNCAVCKHCFAYRQLGIYADQRKKLKRAHAIATRCKWSIADIPYIDNAIYKYFRLECFGDINNTIQVNNYNVLADTLYKLYGIKTTLWTKNPGIIQNAINNGLQLSPYLTIGLSSLELNKPEIDKAKKYSFIKFLFTVYDENYISEHNVNINCGGLHCRSCLKCYELAANTNTLILINEKLK